jgi:hypothetical protein
LEIIYYPLLIGRCNERLSVANVVALEYSVVGEGYTVVPITRILFFGLPHFEVCVFERTEVT